MFGVLGFVFAPQISKALLGDDERLRLPRFMDDKQVRDSIALYLFTYLCFVIQRK